MTHGQVAGALLQVPLQTGTLPLCAGHLAGQTSGLGLDSRERAPGKLSLLQRKVERERWKAVQRRNLEGPVDRSTNSRLSSTRPVRQRNQSQRGHCGFSQTGGHNVNTCKETFTLKRAPLCLEKSVRVSRLSDTR